MAPRAAGLTPFGREVVERLNANRVMVDLSHSGRQICLDAAAASQAADPINHTGCRALTDLPRNKTDEELRLVAEKGGFVGIYFMPFLNLSGQRARRRRGGPHRARAERLRRGPRRHRHRRRHDAIDDLEAYKVALAKEHDDRVAKGVAAPGERADTHPFVDDLRGPDQFRKLYRPAGGAGP